MSQAAPAEEATTAPMLSKAETATELKVNTKTVERLTQSGKLTKFERPGKRGVEVWYLKAEVEALKAERASGSTVAPVARQDKTDAMPQQIAEVLQMVFAAGMQAQQQQLESL